MERNASIYGIVLVSFLHVPVHIRINQAENDGFIAHQGLVMAFRIGDGLFIFAAVGHFPEHAGWLPVFIYFLLDCLNPIIGNIHGHTVIKSVAAIFIFCRQSGHSRYFFGNGDGFGIDLMDKPVGKCQITNGIVVLMSVEVISIITECFSQTMTII